MREIIIRDRGRGPELIGTRITVFDIIPYLQDGCSPNFIAAVLRLSTVEVLALMKYIDEHREEVMAINAKIEERIARGNPPEIEERLKSSPWHAKFQTWLAERKQQHAPGGQW